MKKIVLSLIAALSISACTVLPDEPKIKDKVWLEQGWSEGERHWYHHASQGSLTFPIPYEWFVELEQPINKNNWFTGLIGAENKFSDSEYLQKFGFISSKVSSENPDDLPVGFAESKNVTDPVSGATFNGIGLTCAACHTSQMTYQGTNIRVDGGPAVTNLTDLGIALVVALSETYISPIRHLRFQKNVIKRILKNNPKTTKKEQKAIFKATYKAVMHGVIEQGKLALKMGKKNVTEGFTRLDALNRIGNVVFGTYNPKNIVPTNAPVNYPHLWSTSWFDWVQYDASIMQPMIRNAGEALGVGAPVQLGDTSNQFASTVNFPHQYEMETLLAGKTHPQKSQAFNGLKAPKWPESILGTINMDVAKVGEKLYDKNCASCHRPAVSKKAFWSDKYWKKIKGKGDRYYEVVVIPTKEIGTDPAQSEILANRTVDLSGMGAGIKGKVCSFDGKKWGYVNVTDAPEQSFAFALGLTVERTAQHFYKANNISPAQQHKMNGERPNCLQAPKAYKARPLNGIWATAPFLHNSSVANLYEMLVPAKDRAATLYLGYLEFDPEKVGFISTKADGLPAKKGLTKVIVAGDKARKGNFNSGHEFSNKSGPGIIGPLLSEAERWALVEYLKTL